MKFVQPSPFADPEAAARKLMEIANSVEPVQDGRINIELINWPFLHQLRSSPAEYKAEPPWSLNAKTRDCRSATSERIPAI